MYVYFVQIQCLKVCPMAAQSPSSEKMHIAKKRSWAWTGDALGLLALSALVAFFLTGCSPSKDEAQAGAGAGGPPTVPAGVITVQPQSVPLTVDLPGRLEPIRTAEVRARVAGVVQKRLFTDHYAEPSCTSGRAAFITGQMPIRTGLTTVGLPGSPIGLDKRDPTLAELQQSGQLRLTGDAHHRGFESAAAAGKGQGQGQR